MAAILCVLALTGTRVAAQVTPPRPPAVEPPPLLREEPRPAPAPPSRALPPIPPWQEELPVIKVLIREIRIAGATAFGPQELGRLAAPYVNRELTTEDLEELRQALTLLYVKHGYVNSGAIIPDQAVDQGILVVQVVEGTLTEIEVKGTHWFYPFYLRSRLRTAAGVPLNADALQERLQLLQQDPRLERLQAELKPGVRLGESSLTLTVEERSPFRFTFDFNNHQAPSIGAERRLFTFEHQNLLGLGDTVAVRYGSSEGADLLLDIRYAIPVTPWDTTIAVQFRRSDLTVVERPLRELEVESRTTVMSVGVRHPVYRSLTHELAVEVTGERLATETFLLGERFTLSPGARRGDSIVSALRVGAEYVYRSQTQVLAARSRFTWGLNVLGATDQQEVTVDGQFFAWLGQFQWVRRLPWLDIRVVLRSDVQLADDSLFSIEQIAVGGRYSVRGYRENTLVRDNAVLTSLEVRVPLIRDVPWATFLELAPFIDFGRAWSTRLPGHPELESKAVLTGEQRGPAAHDPRQLAGTGIGLRWALAFRNPVPITGQVEVYWGHRLLRVPESAGNNRSRDLQDKGVHFQLVLGVF